MKSTTSGSQEFFSSQDDVLQVIGSLSHLLGKLRVPVLHLLDVLALCFQAVSQRPAPALIGFLQQLWIHARSVAPTRQVRWSNSRTRAGAVPPSRGPRGAPRGIAARTLGRSAQSYRFASRWRICGAAGAARKRTERASSYVSRPLGRWSARPRTARARREGSRSPRRRWLPAGARRSLRSR